MSKKGKDNLRKYIHEITKASKNGKLVFFVGAGLSTLSGYPKWWKLVNEYYLELHGEKKVSIYSPDEFLRIPQILFDVKGEDALNKVLKRVFSLNKATNIIHDKILELRPAHIITTNYDNLIDEACWQRERYFSVISAEQDVAIATSSSYLLKVHGDFRRGYESKYVVLKESDYINYEQNYPLISNLMKTIMATHTIVFIGYGLGDYNINFLLNWVKQLQKDGYNKPFFIRTEHEPIEENIAVYYEKKGLHIIDATTIRKTSKDEYIKRYNAVVDLLIDPMNNDFPIEDDDVVEYLYRKLHPLFELQCIRKIALKHVFEHDYNFEDNGVITSNKENESGYMERFFKIKNRGVENLSNEARQRFKKIYEFFAENGIIGMKDEPTKKNSE